MRQTIRRALALVSIALVTQAGAAGAQCLTKPAKLDPALNGKDALRARPRRGDQVERRQHPRPKMVTTSEGRLDAEGRASDWSIHFYSTAAQKLNMMSFTKGAMPAPDRPLERRAPDHRHRHDRLRHRNSSIGIAQQAGGSALDAKTVTVNADLAEPAHGRGLAHRLLPAGGTGTVLSVVIDSATGKVISKNPK